VATLRLPLALFLAAAAGCAGPGGGRDGVLLAAFEADVTPPAGHALCGGLVAPAARVADPLSARGLILRGSGETVVVAALDWTELRNDAYERWRSELARAAGTTPSRVLLSCVHQHDAPYADLGAQQFLDAQGLAGIHVDPGFHESAVQAVSAAVRAAAGRLKPVTHVGTGEAFVERIACNRRVVGADGTARFNRYSRTADPAVRDAPEGLIDPRLKTLGFWDGDRPVAALSFYAVHPMSRYGSGTVSADFPGLARARRQAEMPGVFQVYFSGAAGDVTAARYNDGDPVPLAERLRNAMRRAWEAARRSPLDGLKVRIARAEFRIPPEGPRSVPAMERVLEDPSAKKGDRLMAALGLSWARRLQRGVPLEVPCLDLGPASLLLLPAESFVAFQLAAQELRPDRFVAVAGYGECGPGYIPTETARSEGFVGEHGYCWVDEGAEAVLLRAIEAALGPAR
jgi:hypothetical protein